MAVQFQGSARRLTRQRWGGRVTPIERNPVAQTTVGELVANRADRVALIIQNLGVNPVFIGYSPDVSAINGLRIAGSGGSFILTVDEDGELTSLEIHGLATGGTSQLFVMETILETVSELEGVT